MFKKIGIMTITLVFIAACSSAKYPATTPLEKEIIEELSLAESSESADSSESSESESSPK